MFFSHLVYFKAKSLRQRLTIAFHCLLIKDPVWDQWPSSVGALLWRADLILCGEDEGSSSVSDPEGS